MRFNINRPLNATWVDDVPITDLDTSALPPDVLRVKWLDNEGYIYYVDKALNTKITDPSPYQSHINDWMTACIPGTPDAPPLSIAEAKQIKIYLIESLFNTKRQAPFFYSVQAGNLTWEATDGTVAAMSAMMVPVLYNLLTGLSAEGGESQNSLVAQINTMIGQANNRLASMASLIDTNFVSVFTSVTSGIVTVGNSLITYINNTILGTGGDGAPPFNSVNRALVVAVNPLPNNIAHTALVFVSPTGSLPTVAVPPIDPIDGSTVVPPDESIQWIPIGQATPVNLSVPEMCGIMGGIAARRTSLLTTKINKIAAVNALSSITAVIAYDVTTGW